MPMPQATKKCLWKEKMQIKRAFFHFLRLYRLSMRFQSMNGIDRGFTHDGSRPECAFLSSMRCEAKKHFNIAFSLSLNLIYCLSRPHLLGSDSLVWASSAPPSRPVFCGGGLLCRIKYSRLFTAADYRRINGQKKGAS